MKLRIKKTGEIKDFGNLQVYAETENTDESQLLGNFDSFKQILEYYEDYILPEPLIKDEKIRKAVRAWAKADDLDNFRVKNQHFNECKIIGYTAGINKASSISFQTTVAYADNEKVYTITELCGEEEE